jgi:SAM-dependent methyltransferase
LAVFRIDRIVELCVGKSVLHLGFVQHSYLYETTMSRGEWLHEKINAVAKRLVGLDYLEDDVGALREKFGYEAYVADVTRLPELALDEKFDVIVCGELIEHIDNPGLMLEGIKRFMFPESILIVTTPNPWSTARLALIRQGKWDSEWLNPEHVCWHTHQTLKQLLDRCGYEEVDYGYYYGETKATFVRNAGGLLGKLKLARRKHILSHTRKGDYDGLFFVARRSGSDRQ